MKKVLGIISLLLSATLATANSIDFDKAFKDDFTRPLLGNDGR